MRVVAKFAAVFLLASCVCLAVYSYLAARTEVARLQSNVASDLTSLGRGLSDGVRVTWETSGEAPALRIVEAADARHSDVTVRWVHGAPADDVVRSSVVDTPTGRVVRVSIPVRPKNGGGGSVELERGVPDEGAIVRSELVDQLGFAVLLAVLGAFLAVTLGGALIGRPLQRMVDQARRIGAGDLTARLGAARVDEIGELERELNAMCERLLEAQKKVEEESTARLETLEQLRQLDRLRTVGTLASSIAHELGTPLNVLLLRGQSLAQGDLDDRELRDTGSAIVVQVDKMSRIVRELLDFARKQPNGQADIDLADVARHATRLLHAIARKNGVDLVLRAPEPVRVTGSFGHLEQALTNLIVNGIHAMPQGGALEVTVGSEPGEDGKKIPMAFVTVTDHGKGIADEDLARIFEAFFTTKAAGQGTGLGLPVAMGIAEDHRGTISVTSQVGKGSTFKLLLPRAA